MKLPIIARGKREHKAGTTAQYTKYMTYAKGWNKSSNTQQGYCKPDGNNVFSMSAVHEMRKNRFKLQQGKFRLDTGKCL